VHSNRTSSLANLFFVHFAVATLALQVIVLDPEKTGMIRFYTGANHPFLVLELEFDLFSIHIWLRTSSADKSLDVVHRHLSAYKVL
jgi:hypothetical protein